MKQCPLCGKKVGMLSGVSAFGLKGMCMDCGNQFLRLSRLSKTPDTRKEAEAYRKELLGKYPGNTLVEAAVDEIFS